MENIGLTLKHMSVLSGINHASVYKYVQNHKIEPIPSKWKKRGLKYDILNTRRIMTHFFASKKPVDPKRKIIAGFHFKGGTGKSSINTELAVMLALLGYRVLLIDGDQQGHASHILGFDSTEKLPTLYDCVKHNMRMADVVSPVFEGLDAIPANLSLTDIEDHFRSLSGENSVKCISNLLVSIEEQYDFIVFDTAPSITDLNRNIFYASHIMNLVCDTQPASVQSLSQIEDYLQDFCEKYHKKFPWIRIIPNKYEDRASSSVETVNFLQQNWADKIIKDFAVRKSEDIPKAFLEQMPVSLMCKVNSIAFEDLSIVARDTVEQSKFTGELELAG